MSTQRTGEYSTEARTRRPSPDPSSKLAKDQINQQIKGGAGKAVLQHGGQGDISSRSYSSSMGATWDSLPSLWRSALLLEVLFFGLPGLLSLFYPSLALDYVRAINHKFNWAGPSPGVASNTLLMYVQWGGALSLSLACLAAWGSYIRSVDFARGWAIFRLVLSGCLLYIGFLQPGTSYLGLVTRPLFSFMGLPKEVYTAGSTTYKFLLIPFAHSVLMTSLLAMSPEFLQGLFQKAPTFLA